MQFEFEEPTLRTFPTCFQTFKSLMYMYSLVPAYSQWRGIHKTNYGTCTQQYLFDEYSERKQYFLFQFNKAVVGNSPWEEMRQMLTDIFQIKMFESSVSSWMKKNHDKHDFRITHAVRLITMLFILLNCGEHIFFLIFCKFFAEIVCQTINFSKFSLE